jgi:type IV pilus assembly protein PilQ
MAITPMVLAITQLPLSTSAQSVQPLGAGSAPSAAATAGPTGGAIEMRVRRLPDAVELVVQGVGSSPQLQQSIRGTTWEGMLFLAQPGSLRRGPQSITLAEAGFQSFSISGAGRGYRLQVTPTSGAALPRPVVSADGRDLILSFSAPSQPRLQTLQPSVTTPGWVPQTSFVPPLQPRAVAPPLGDIAVGTMMLANPSYLQVSGPPVTMMVDNSPVRNVLMSLSRMGGYGFVYVDDPASASKSSSSTGGFDASQIGLQRPVSLTFNNENFARAFNSTLLAAGLQGKREGNLILVGPNVLSKTFGSTMSKVYRLNQISSNAAADYLANLGAVITKVNTITTSVTEGTSQSSAISGAPSSATTQSSTTREVESYGSGKGPLQGLLGTTDSRLGTITLVGDPRVVAVAENYLRQLDLRQRQVALSVRILDVTLDNDTAISNSFAFRYGNNFIVNDRGRLVGAFGSLLPPQVNPEGNVFTPVQTNPGSAYPEKPFFDLVKAQIESRTTKVLASPTLILTDNPERLREGTDQSILSQTLSTNNASSSGSNTNTNATIGRTRANEGFVTVGEQVITNYSTTAGQNGAPTTCQPQFGVAGLTFGARVSKIDDNGFVTFSISPTITAATRQQQIPNCGPIEILAIRSLDSGGARVRDGQTLIMTGVISDYDSKTVRKWPILGDMPLIGQFFRDTNGGRRKRELVIMVTPRILREDQGGAFGYGYQPSTPQAREFAQQSGG